MTASNGDGAQRTVLITGGGTGLGKEIARAFVELGDQLEFPVAQGRDIYRFNRTTGNATAMFRAPRGMALAGISFARDGSLLVANAGNPTSVLRFDPTIRAWSVVTSGGSIVRAVDVLEL